MIATGIVRRIDDLGRIVIPKDIRKKLKIEEADAYEIFYDSDNNILLKPLKTNSPLSIPEFIEENSGSIDKETTSFLSYVKEFATVHNLDFTIKWK